MRPHRLTQAALGGIAGGCYPVKVRVTLAMLVLFAWLFALTFITAGALCVAAVDLLVWLEFGAASAALHLAVIAAVILRRRIGAMSCGIPT